MSVRTMASFSVLLLFSTGCRFIDPGGYAHRQAADLAEQHEYDEAVGVLRQMMLGHPDASQAKTAPEAIANILMDKALFLYQQGDIVGAGKAYHDVAAEFGNEVTNKKANERDRALTAANLLYLYVVLDGQTDSGLKGACNLPAVMKSDGFSSESVIAASKDWACGSIADFPAYKDCFSPPPLTQTTPLSVYQKAAPRWVEACDIIIEAGETLCGDDLYNSALEPSYKAAEAMVQWDTLAYADAKPLMDEIYSLQKKREAGIRQLRQIENKYKQGVIMGSRWAVARLVIEQDAVSQRLDGYADRGREISSALDTKPYPPDLIGELRQAAYELYD